MIKIHQAIKDKNLVEIKSLSAQGFSVEEQDNLNQTPLHIACSYSEEIALYLIGIGVDIHAMDYNNDSPLHVAAQHQLKTVMMLVEKGADIECKNDDNETALELSLGKDYLK